MKLPLKLKCQTYFSFHHPMNLSKPKERTAKPSPFTESKTQLKPISVAQTQLPKTSTKTYNKVEFKTLEGCKLGISRYPYFEYNAEGGNGKGIATPLEDLTKDEILVYFDPKEVYIPPMSSKTTRFLGLPLPPFLKIEIVPELFKGSIHKQSGKVDLEFKAKFWFSVGSLYRAPALVVATVLTSEESRGETKGGSGRRLDSDGSCRLVGVARVEPIDDVFINTFLQLPTECIAVMSALISFSDQPS
ncbi:hypothetical protein V2J09_014535 [Rumex salicifolius]